MKRNVLQFNDIKEMLNEDEMRGILGGCGEGGSGYVDGGTLNTVTIYPTNPGGYTDYGNGGGYGDGGFGYGQNNYGAGQSNGGGGGGSTGGTTMTYAQKMAEAMNRLFPGFMANHNNMIITTDTPPGFTLRADNSFLDANGNTVFGNVYRSGNLTIISISKYVLDNIAANSQDGIIGHELVHALNIEQNYNEYITNYAQFRLNSELAAYNYQMDRAMSIRDQATVDRCMAEINSLIAKGATGGYSSKVE